MINLFPDSVCPVNTPGSWSVIGPVGTTFTGLLNSHITIVVANLLKGICTGKKMSDVQIQNNRLTINTFKPKVVEMHTREHLEQFREAAEATGMGLNWLHWRFTVQVGSTHWKQLVKAKAIPANRLQAIYMECGIEYKAETTVKMEAAAEVKGALTEGAAAQKKKQWGDSDSDDEEEKKKLPHPALALAQPAVVEIKTKPPTDVAPTPVVKKDVVVVDDAGEYTPL